MQETIGRFTLLGPLGRGAMGAVYLAADPVLNRQVAIKMVDLSIEEAGQREFLRERLLRDAKAAALLSHPNVVGVYDILQTDDAAYVVMEYVPGESLAGYLERIPLPGKDFTVGVLRQIAAALDYTHGKGIIHRDIKPGNVMCEPNGAVKILDFGIARLSGGRTSTPTGIVMGTIEYMSPEQLKGETPEGRSDQFSLAAVAYKMLTGSTLFGQHTMATLAYKAVNEMPMPATARNAALPAAVDPVLTKALAKLPSERFTTCSEFAEALNRAFEGPAFAKSMFSDFNTLPGTEPIVRPATKRNSMGSILLFAALIGVAVAVGLLLWKPLSRPEEARKVEVVNPPPTVKPPPEKRQSDGAKTVHVKKPPVANVESAKRTPVVTVPEKPPDSHDLSRLYRDGQEQVKRGDFASAVRSFTAVLAINPELQKAYFSRGYAHQLADETEAAIQDYSRAIQLNPEDPLSHADRGVCLVRMHRDNQALADFNRALELKPELPHALNGRGGVYLRRGEYVRAIREFDAALRMNPGFIQAYENRARAKRLLGDATGANADVRKAEELRGK